VARLAGVSVGTVSNVVNHPELVRDETRIRVLDVIRRLGWMPNPAGAALARGAAQRRVAALVPRLTDPAAGALVAAMLDELQRARVSLVVSQIDNIDDVDREVRFATAAGAHAVCVVARPEWLSAPLAVRTPAIVVATLPTPASAEDATSLQQGTAVARRLLEQLDVNETAAGRASFRPKPAA
jgi:DNA-binding LacI/PurR family transcriptional regulator